MSQIEAITKKIDEEYKWLMQTKHTLHDIDIAFNSIKKFVRDLEQEPYVTMRDLSDEEIKHFAEEMKKVRLQTMTQEPSEDWHDVPSYEMTLGQARQAVKELRKKLAEHLKQEPCEDAVSRQSVLEELRTCFDTHTIYDENNGENYIIYEDAVDMMEKLPSVTPTRKKGKWIKVTETDFGIGYKCSECGRFILTESVDGKKLKDYPYCHCGAEMESENV